MESMLLTFSILALIFLLKFHASKPFGLWWIIYGILSAISFTITISIKFIGIYSIILGFLLTLRYLWTILPNKLLTNIKLSIQIIYRTIIFTIIPICLYLFIYYYHLNILHKAGPHDSIMTSAFQVRYLSYLFYIY